MTNTYVIYDLQSGRPWLVSHFVPLHAAVSFFFYSPGLIHEAHAQLRYRCTSPLSPRAQFIRAIRLVLLIIRKRSWLHSLKCDTAAIKVMRVSRFRAQSHVMYGFRGPERTSAAFTRREREGERHRQRMITPPWGRYGKPRRDIRPEFCTLFRFVCQRYYVPALNLIP